MSTPNKTIDVALQELKEAELNYSNQYEEVEMARRGLSNALNRLNDKQKQFDSLVAEIKADPVRASDWASKEYQMEMADE